jgi:phosphoribosylaminoimidazolecarboxamide formyltransferase/IMP cyclohydrolase
LIGIGSGQTSRVDAARQAVAKAHAFRGAASTVGASCGSDAFVPVPDAIEACLEAGVGAFAQPGGSMRDAAAIAVVDAADGTMLVTGTRHFRH